MELSKLDQLLSKIVDRIEYALEGSLDAKSQTFEPIPPKDLASLGNLALRIRQEMKPKDTESQQLSLIPFPSLPPKANKGA